MSHQNNEFSNSVTSTWGNMD